MMGLIYLIIFYSLESELVCFVNGFQHDNKMFGKIKIYLLP